jgi:uridine kinase
MSITNAISWHLLTLSRKPVLKVGIDGVDGVGKTTFADKIAVVLTSHGRQVIRSSVDGFHNPRSIRYRLGKTSPEGFYRGSYDYAALRHHLLEPLSGGGSRRYRTAVFDHVSDKPVVTDELEASEGAILLFDGLFLHRPELRAYWDFSIFLDTPFEVTAPRGAARGPGFGDPDPSSQSNRRYTEGNLIYLREPRLHDHATVFVDYSDLSSPRVLDCVSLDPRKSADVGGMTRGKRPYRVL